MLIEGADCGLGEFGWLVLPEVEEAPVPCLLAGVVFVLTGSGF